MPIYAYRCTACGHAKDVLQKISDPVLTTCPSCGVESFAKQVTAAGFQLKGSGWYVTDFRGGSGGGGSTGDKAAEGSKPEESASGGSSGGTGSAEASSGSSSGGSSAESGGTTATTAAGGCGASCACH